MKRCRKMIQSVSLVLCLLQMGCDSANRISAPQGDQAVSSTPPTTSVPAENAAPKKMSAALFGQHDEKAANVIYLIDSSGSMMEVLTAFDASDYVKDKLHGSVKSLDEKQKFHMIFFAGEYLLQLKAKTLVPATPKNKAEAKELMDDVEAIGQTNILPALEKAFEILPQSGKGENVIFLLTDGDFRGREPKVLEYLRKANKDKKVKIYTFLFVNVGIEGPEKILKQIAKENGGKFKAVELPED